MIDTYMDKASWPTWMTPSPAVDRDDPRYWNGALYNTVIDRMVAEAKFELQGQLAFSVAHHKRQILNGFAQARAGGAA
jgi:hypothetical protein